MAFIEKAGGSFVVKQGNTGEVLSRHSSRAKAQKEVDRLHRKNKPKSSNRGTKARAKVGSKAKKK